MNDQFNIELEKNWISIYDSSSDTKFLEFHMILELDFIRIILRLVLEISGRYCYVIV
jgi:hypothetical protein